MREDYYDTLLNKKACEVWHNMCREDQIVHILKGTKEYKDYQRAIKHGNSYVHTMLDGATRRDEFINSD